MDTKDLDTEVRPLKNNSEKTQESSEPANSTKTQGGLCRLSRWRSVAFFASLFLCLIVVFAFSFIIPCPVRPISERTWNAQYDNAETFGFLSTEDVNQDKVKDVIFLVKAENSSAHNSSCAEAGLQSPCVFMVALSGTNGSELWSSPIAGNVQLAQCGINQQAHAKSSVCFVVDTAGSVMAIASNTGRREWQTGAIFPADAVVTSPLLQLPDEDDTDDLLVFAAFGDELQGVLLSGSTGKLIGTKQSIGRKARHYLHTTWHRALYVLFYTESSIEAYSVGDLYTRLAGTTDKPALHRQDPDWEQQANKSAGYVPIIPASSSGDILYLLNVPGTKYNHILVVRSEVSELLDGQTFKSRWSMNTTNILSKPAFGYFKKDFLSIVMELGLADGWKKVIIVDGNSGSKDWEAEVASGQNHPGPVTLHTGDRRSFFFFWGDLPADRNNTMVPKQSLFLFHPLHPSAWLLLNNHTENVISFNGKFWARQGWYLGASHSTTQPGTKHIP
ncbi:protein FAM234A [Bombina bombina]|uniref:protein FAM234A n=1 Tax=Bombina bombina TaxID=8345 RepID=UPI00235A7591|nr:protein FAM234A [Bombina bombina]